MKKLFLTVLMCSFLLSSCTTTRYVSYTTPQDNIISFIQLKENTGEIRKDSLIIMGENFNYVMSPLESEQLVKIFNADLSNKHKYDFVISDERTTWTMKSIDIVIDENNKFKTHFCLRYQIDENNIQDKEILTHLGFKSVWSDTYVSCMSIRGKVYATNPQQILPKDYYFQTPIKVHLSVEEKQYDKEGTKILFVAPVTTPLFVAGAVVVVPVIIGLTVLSGGKLE